MFVDWVQKRYCYLSVSTFTSKNINGILFFVWYTLNIFFLLFSGALSWKCVNHTFSVAVSTVDTTEHTLFLCLYPLKSQHLLFMLSFGLQNINRTVLLSSKPLNKLDGTFVVVCLLLNTLFVHFFFQSILSLEHRRLFVPFLSRET